MSVVPDAVRATVTSRAAARLPRDCLPKSAGSDLAKGGEKVHEAHDREIADRQRRRVTDEHSLRADDAGRVVQITIEPETPAAKTQQEYWDFLDATAGAWQGDFERSDQGDYEERNLLA